VRAARCHKLAIKLAFWLEQLAGGAPSTSVLRRCS